MDRFSKEHPSWALLKIDEYRALIFFFSKRRNVLIIVLIKCSNVLIIIFFYCCYCWGNTRVGSRSDITTLSWQLTAFETPLAGPAYNIVKYPSLIPIIFCCFCWCLFICLCQTILLPFYESTYHIPTKKTIKLPRSLGQRRKPLRSPFWKKKTLSPHFLLPYSPPPMSIPPCSGKLY